MDAVELAFAGIARQAELIAGGEVSPSELVETYLERIERIDPQLNAFRVVLADRARDEAREAGTRLAAGERQPLLGVPIAIKDDTDVAGEVTAWGSDAHGPAADRDAEVVARLRAAGAVVIGKTSVPELTIFPFTESRRFGPTRNPWNTAHTPGGSSGGAAAAVAAGLVGAGMGSDGGGSIRIPAACCGLVGIKPQRDRVQLARPGHWHGLDHFGPLARRVRDAALLLDVVAQTGGEFSAAAADVPRRLRIAFSAKVPPGALARVDPEVCGALEGTARLVESLGHETTWQDPDYGLASAAFIARYLRGIHDDAQSVAHPERLEPRTRGIARMGALVPPWLLARARRAEAAQSARINALFDTCDVLIMPTLATPPVEVGRWEGRGALGTFNGMARFVPFTGAFNHTGQPAMAVPAGFGSGGLPLSVQLVGRPGDEATLLSLAAQIESERLWADRHPPVS